MNLRTKLGNRLFKLAAKMYPDKGEKKNALRSKLGNRLFKLASKVSPDKQ